VLTKREYFSLFIFSQSELKIEEQMFTFVFNKKINLNEYLLNNVHRSTRKKSHIVPELFSLKFY